MLECWNAGMLEWGRRWALGFVRGFRFSVRGSRFSVRGSRFPVPGGEAIGAWALGELVRGSRFSVGRRWALGAGRWAGLGSRFPVGRRLALGGIGTVAGTAADR